MKEKNKILITGSTGFVGNILVNYLRLNNGLYTLSRSRADYNYDLALEIPRFKQHFDLVIHAAGLSHFVSESVEDDSIIYKTNVVGTENLLKGLYNYSLPKYFIFLSSVSVYGLCSGTNISETSPLLARDSYGLSKIKAEQLVIDWCRNQEITCTILRLPLLVGPNPPGNLGAMMKAIKRGYYLNISGGEAKKSMVLAEDVAKFITKVAAIGGIFNLTDGYHPSFAELSSLIAKRNGKQKVYNLPSWFAKIAAHFGDVLGQNFPLDSKKLNKMCATLTFDDTKAKETFGWRPTRVLDGFKW
jgi:nucleoside-diphosphate-sugar epimerase